MENNYNSGSPGQGSLNVNPKDLPWLGCSEGIQAYDSAVMFKRLSPLLSPNGKEEFIPAEIILCRKCGKIPPFFATKSPDFPAELRSTCDAKKA